MCVLSCSMSFMLPPPPLLYLYFTYLSSFPPSLSPSPRSKEQKKILPVVLKSCRDFFMEVISGLCFGQSSAPEDKLVEMLLNIVFTEREEGGAMRPGTRELTPYKDDLKKMDESPVIRSFLLQLLLEHKCVMVEGGEEGGSSKGTRE